MRIQLKRGTEAHNDAFVGLEGGLTVDMTNWTLRLHDGVTPGGRVVGTVTPATGGGQTISAGSVALFQSSVILRLDFFANAERRCYPS